MSQNHRRAELCCRLARRVLAATKLHCYITHCVDQAADELDDLIFCISAPDQLVSSSGFLDAHLSALLSRPLCLSTKPIQFSVDNSNRL